MSLWSRALPSDVCGVSPGNAELKAIIGGRELAAPTFPVKVVEPQPPIKITAWIVTGKNDAFPLSVVDVQNMIAPLNDIYRQVGVSFYLDSVTVTKIPDAYNAFYDSPSTPTETWTFDDIVGIASGTRGWSVVT